MDNCLLPEEKELGIYEDNDSDGDDLASEHGDEAATKAKKDCSIPERVSDRSSIARATKGESVLQSSTVVRTVSSHDKSSPASPSKDEEKANVLVNAALELLHQRCVSVVKQKSPFYETTRSPLTNHRSVKYVSVSQTQPLPMEPLKAWKGYNGNLYFEPISIKPARIRAVSTAADSAETGENAVALRAGKARTAPAGRRQERRSSAVPEHELIFRQMSLLDKRAVVSRLNKNLHEDLTWIRGQEAVGSLIEAASPGDKARERDKYRLERICRGSVARAAHDSRSPAASRKSVAVSGAKFHAPLFMSPLLRSTTQYSQSARRAVTSSPETFNTAGSYDRLPPLEQLRASLRHIDNSPTKMAPSYRYVDLPEKPLAYVKYSRDVKTLY